MKFWSFLLIILLGMQACTSKNTGADNKDALDYNMPPSWAREAIWYQML